jgi:hypothetical protein
VVITQQVRLRAQNLVDSREFLGGQGVVNKFVERARRQLPRAPKQPQRNPNRQQRVDEHPAREVNHAQREQQPQTRPEVDHQVLPVGHQRERVRALARAPHILPHCETGQRGERHHRCAPLQLLQFAADNQAAHALKQQIADDGNK